MSLLVYLGATFAFKRDSVTGARIPCTCYRSSLPCPRANHWITLLRAYSGLHRAYLANQQIIGIHCFGPTRAYLGPTLPTSKSLEYIAMQSLLCNLCCAIFAVQYLLRNLCYAIFARQSLLSQSLRSYLGPTFANQPIPLEKSGIQT